jgi:outer membrane protein assembly factor BamB
MNTATNTGDTTQHKPVRLLPGVIIVTLQWVIRFLIPEIIPGDSALMIGVAGGLAGGLAVGVWWIFFSRAPWTERWNAITLITAALVVASFLLDESIATANMGMMFVIFSIPVMSLAFVVWAVATRHLSKVPRRTTMIMTIVVASGFWIFLRTDGMDAELHHDLKWRWAETAEERLIRGSNEEPEAIPGVVAEKDTNAYWPGFRGSDRNSIIHGIKINTDWSVSQPDKMWRRPVGPGCSSFAVNGRLFYTQEQIGDYEVVSCYSLATGKPIWKHRDKARFYDSHAGAGPRSTPTLAGNCIYALGATGILNVLSAVDGSVLWSRNAASDNGVKVLTWGFTGSPLVLGDAVIVSLSGKLAAYSKENGSMKWSGADGGNSYSSPHLVTFDGVKQIVLMSDSGALSVDPGSGKKLWKYDWPVGDRILQPAVIGEGDLLIPGEMKGISRVKISHTQGEWTAKEIWTSAEMKVNFNDLVIHKGHAYGFDGPRIECIDLKDGKLKWRGNPYRGWLLLLADQDLLIVLSEKGQLALVEANPDKFTELARFQAIRGKTWNHPVLAGEVLLVRNNLEMAAFRLFPKI